MNADSREPESGKFDWSGLTLFLLSIAAVLLCGLIAWPFLAGITGAIVLAIVTQRPYRWLSARLRNPTLTAVVALVLVVLSIVVPMLFVVQSAAYHVLDTVRSVQSGAAGQQFRQFIGENPRIGSALRYAMDNVDVSQAFESSASSLTGKLASLLGQSIFALIQVVVMLFILFFLYRDKAQALRMVRSFLPLDKEESDYLLRKIQTAVQALVLGRFVVAGIQGLIAGITFACLGVPGAILLGGATLLTALVPAVGAFVVWLPVVIYLALLHHWIQAIILLAVGSLIISTIDNVLYPILVGSRLRLHTVPIFLSMLGGVWLFGVVGLVLGPIAFSVTASLILIWRERTKGEPLPSATRDGASEA